MDLISISSNHAIAPLITPRDLSIALPPNDRTFSTISQSRRIVKNILTGLDSRFLVICGPCSIHDYNAALEYATHLHNLQQELQDKFYFLMRVYFEKPRSSTGWKGLLNDPFLDGSENINEGLRIGRKLLLQITEMGLGTAMEIVDPFTSYYLSDLASWISIGARTSESQIHRQMASGLDAPVGIKNCMDGDLVSSVNSILASTKSHRFMGLDREGKVCLIQTGGNPWSHTVLRGSRQGPNYDQITIDELSLSLTKNKLMNACLIDCSHANSNKNFANQVNVWRSILELKRKGKTVIKGAMLESNIHEGNQPLQSKELLKYGVSITDACISWETTEKILRDAYKFL